MISDVCWIGRFHSSHMFLYSPFLLQRLRRIWLIDRQASSIGTELRDDLGNWIRRRLMKGVTAQGKKARETIQDCGIPISELREQWGLQQASQLSLRSRKHTDHIFCLDLISHLSRCSRPPEERARYSPQSPRRPRRRRQRDPVDTRHTCKVLAFTRLSPDAVRLGTNS